MHHDFSARGLDSVDATISSGLGHATSFLGSDTLTVIHGARKYYGATGTVVMSVPATEHSVSCSNTTFNADGTTDELEGIRYQLSKVPKGIFSMVSDTFDLWRMCTEYLPALKQEILARDGKLVIRPDSGNPVDIICGNPNADSAKPEHKGVVELLWDVFGGTVNEQGYRVLDPHIGAIYGDSITLERAEQIYTRLADKGFASTNIVLGVGSFTYQFNTRDTIGAAIKATYIEIGGIGKALYKDPVTDDGTKKSATGLLQVVKEDGEYRLIDNVTWEQEDQGELQVIYHNGLFANQTTFQEIRDRLKKQN
jgi:nicotinamide phosphoribosyltransferase